MSTQQTTQYTPGPWRVAEDGARVVVGNGVILHPYEPRLATQDDEEDFDCGDDYQICVCEGSYFDRPPDECAANARLIAAAPELLQTCIDMDGWLENCGYGKDHPWRHSLARAIAKAEGRAE